MADEQSAEEVDAARWERLATEALEAQGVRGDAELSLLFVDEVAMAELNLRFRAKDGPTDVLSFPIDDDVVAVSARNVDPTGPGPEPDFDPSDVPRLIGDVVICPTVARRNVADRQQGTYEDELALLVVHGILHLLGMDHEDDAEAEAMQARERELLERFHRS